MLRAPIGVSSCVRVRTSGVALTARSLFDSSQEEFEAASSTGAKYGVRRTSGCQLIYFLEGISK